MAVAVDRHNLPANTWITEGTGVLVGTAPDGALWLTVRRAVGGSDDVTIPPTARLSIGATAATAAEVAAELAKRPAPVLVGMAATGPWGLAVRPGVTP